MHPCVEAAHAWRHQNGYERMGGIVIIGSVYISWIERLRNPEYWPPGTVAVDSEGHAWLAVGGTRSCGAVVWMPTDAAAWRHTSYAIGGHA